MIVLRVTAGNVTYLVELTKGCFVIETDCSQLKQRFKVAKGSVRFVAPNCLKVIQVGEPWELAYRVEDLTTEIVRDLSFVMANPDRFRPKPRRTL